MLFNSSEFRYVCKYELTSLDHNGAYLLDGHLAPNDEVKPYAADTKEAEKLWKLSEELVQENFTY